MTGRGEAPDTAEGLFDDDDLVALELAYIDEVFGPDAADEVITAICLGTHPAAALAKFKQEIDDIDSFFDGVDTDVAVPLRSAA